MWPYGQPGSSPYAMIFPSVFHAANVGFVNGHPAGAGSLNGSLTLKQGSTYTVPSAGVGNVLIPPPRTKSASSPNASRDRTPRRASFRSVFTGYNERDPTDNLSACTTRSEIRPAEPWLSLLPLLLLLLLLAPPWQLQCLSAAHHRFTAASSPGCMYTAADTAPAQNWHICVNASNLSALT